MINRASKDWSEMKMRLLQPDKPSKHYLKWSIMPYRQLGGAGAYDQPTGNVVDSGVFSLPEDDEVDKDDSYIFVAHSNVTEWLAERRQRTGGDKDEKYMLQWLMSESTAYKQRCGRGNLIWRAQHLFGLEAPGDSDSIYFKPETDKGVAPNVTEVPECPVFGAVIDILPNATDSTCIVLSDELDKTGTPCAIKIDEAAAQQIATRVSELADAAQATRAPESDKTEESEDDTGAGSRFGASITGLSFAAALACLF
ncbi:unnamed protein product [Parascedosporium putredinis]|uniref:DUF7136 domain-containing protein n=1 Tax=Parascedosporium putredinis TaxID=1442378 RepID=A0A9P1GY48_9PEZI|nr:unnamed protein product [Parascedosporium putredinis]CAI7990329.1 unnamed protein product [Parascedosporium putredinis]